MNIEAKMRAVFDALARDDMDNLISYWAEDGTYFNPSIGPAAQGREGVYDTIAALSQRLQQRGETLVVDRVTPVEDAQPPRLYVEWHVAGGEKPGRLGLHVASFSEAGQLHRVTVFAHP